MTNEKDANVVHNLFAEFHYADDLGVIKSKLAEYVVKVRKEERKAAFNVAEKAVWLATKDFEGILNEVQRKAIALATATYIEAALTEK